MEVYVWKKWGVKMNEGVARGVTELPYAQNCHVNFGSVIGSIKEHCSVAVGVYFLAVCYFFHQLNYHLLELLIHFFFESLVLKNISCRCKILNTPHIFIELNIRSMNYFRWNNIYLNTPLTSRSEHKSVDYVGGIT